MELINKPFSDIPDKNNRDIFISIASRVREIFPDEEVKVYARGSRIGSNFTEDSDYDIAIISQTYEGTHNAPEISETLYSDLGVKVDVWVMRYWETEFPLIPKE